MHALAFMAVLAAGGVVESNDDLAYKIGHELRCPVCQGMPISESPSDMAQAMMKRTRELVAEGKSEDEVRAYFVARYGEWVLLEPTRQGANLFIWILPPFVLLGGAFLAWRIMRRRNPATPTAPPAATDDPYIARVRAALDEDS